ncbi:unnamed protein product [Didymodactylos carnosus]|uniref:CCHC-type domain-containing protein n=1 Tax=Didymodactylos carnosus TaxID=1234261 RepID=A0A8S2JDQ4_9BILA|nr:unnamed protein product [Didymodactylos carnosus]CAF3802967.1 unnamed protein product [Didymodactylos carnosus]
MGDNRYDNLTAAQEDNLCEDDENNFEENEGFRQQTKHRQHKRPNYNASDERSKIITSRTYTNSNSNSNINEKRNNQQGRMQMNNNNRYNNNDHDQNENEHQIQISQQALNYAAEIHLQPIKFECNPKFTEQKLAAKFIHLFFKYIEKDFREQNQTFPNPLGLDRWWIDRDGNIQGISKEIELYVYLCNIRRYPNEIDNVKMIPHPPKHLPPQRSMILKWVKNTISSDEVKDELASRFKSIYTLEDIIGTSNTRNRHIKMDLADETEYNTILNSGKVTIFGQLLDCDEYLPAPKLLICSKCNLPGHIKKICSNSQVEMCVEKTEMMVKIIRCVK